MPGVVSSAKDPTFSEHVTEMVREHRVLVDRLIAYWEFQHEEINLLAEVIYHENWHTDKEKRAAYLTGAVVMNRVNSPLWPNTVKAVLHESDATSIRLRNIRIVRMPCWSAFVSVQPCRPKARPIAGER